MDFVANEVLPECTGNAFVYKYFGECLEGPAAVCAFVIGLTSILFWLFAQAPQLLLNYRNGNADSLAPLFLLQWLLGDITNLVGAIMTKQLATQIYTAYYFVAMDIALTFQFGYYSFKNRCVAPVHQNPYHQTQESRRKRNVSLGCVGVLCMIPIMMSQQSQFFTPSSSNFAGRSLQRFDVFDDKTSTIGYVLGIVSAVLYLCSRVPQIVKNFRRKSTGGLAFTMFILAALGNLSYSLSIFMISMEPDFILSKLPWIVGSIGTLIFDFTIFMQFFCFKDTSEKYVVDQRFHHRHVPSKSEASETTPLYVNIEDGEGIEPEDIEEDYHEPISPLIYPAAQKSNYYY